MSKKKQRVKFETNFAKLGTVLQGQTGLRYENWICPVPFRSVDKTCCSRA